MSISAAHADTFYREVKRAGTVWAVRDDAGFPAAQSDGHRVMPFWSSENRVLRVVEQVDAYRHFKVVSIPLDEWRQRWLPSLAKDGLKVGLNWSGTRATGHDVAPADVEAGLGGRSSWS